MRIEHHHKASWVVVGAAIIDGHRVLAAQRTAPPEVAGRWEFPGGKVEHGESDAVALARECAEELGVRIEVGPQVGPDVRLAHGAGVLRVYAARLLHGDRPQALEHSAMRWLTVAELDEVLWLPADAPIVEALRPTLAPAADPA